MSSIRVEATDVIDARPEQVYAVISDYRVGHPAILPKPYFTELTVEEGGQGAGTITRVHMKVMGKEFAYHHRITEPEPGRRLVETDIETGQWSSFTIEPINGGAQSRVTITAEMPVSPGIVGVIEKLTSPSFTRRLFQQELRNLDEYLRSGKAAG